VVVVDILVILVSLVGVAGTIIPVLPGTLLILAGATAHWFLTGFASPTATQMLILGALAVSAQLVDWVFQALGAWRFGASRWGFCGAIAGSIGGLVILGPAGLLLGPVLGAILGELLGGAEPDQALRAAAGVIIGEFGALFLRFIIGVIMVFLVMRWI